MSTTRSWSAGAAVISLVLVIAAWFLMIGPKRSDAASLKQQRVAQLATNQRLQLEIAQLKAQSASLPSKQAELQVIQRQLPNNPALPSLIRSLSGIAGQAGVTLTSIAPGAPTALSTAATTGPATAAAPASTGTTTTGSAASATPSQVVAIPVTIITTGSYAENELFLQKLQTSVTRALLVQGLTLAPATSANPTTSGTTASSSSSDATSGDDLSLTVTGEVFVMPATTVPATSTAVGTAGTTTTPAKTTGSAS